jgi:hypothetical protein
MVGICTTQVMDIYCSDLWLDGYAGEPNPGPDFVRQEFAKVNTNAHLNIVTGDAARTVPEWFKTHPEVACALVDGDHSESGAERDLVNVSAHISVGGLLLFDDICHPAHPGLLPAWRRVMDKRNFELLENHESGSGWAAAIRRA